METTFSVMIRKTVQVQQYEPTVVEIRMESSCQRDQVVMEYGKAFAEIKSEMNRIFKVKPKASGLLD